MIKLFLKNINKNFLTRIFNRINLRILNLWEIFLIFFTILIILIFIFSFQLYFKIERDEIFMIDQELESSEPLVVLNKEKILKIIKAFESKADEFDKLKNKRSEDIIDLSL